MVTSAQRTRLNGFTDDALDRCGDDRMDPAWMATRRRAADARFLACDADGRAATRDGRLRWLDAAAIAPAEPANFLGVLGDRPLFALRAPVAPERLPDATWLTLYSAAAQLDRAEAGLFAYAQALANWQHTTRYCGACGSPLTLTDGGHRARCAKCGHEEFPRTDAAIIVIVGQGDACLLGRKPDWRARQYSTLAGFVEPGESLAATVRREVHEETGVDLIDCDFHSSQPWPFPASLMLGFTATAKDRHITLRKGGELEDARWFTARDLASGLRDGSLRVPIRASIAYHLINHWLLAHGGPGLDELTRAG